jgi:preprotein translocase subunit SecF
MIWGVIVGTWSSVYVAAVVVKLLGVKRNWDKPGDKPGTQFATSD